MAHRGLAVHRTIVALDVEGFGARDRTNRNQVAVRDGLYTAVRAAFGEAGIPWADHDHEDRGDGMFILAGADVPKSLFVELLPSALVSALRKHNGGHPDSERIRLRLALHAGEVNYDEHGATAAAIPATTASTAAMIAFRRFPLLPCLDRPGPSRGLDPGPADPARPAPGPMTGSGAVEGSDAYHGPDDLLPPESLVTHSTVPTAQLSHKQLADGRPPVACRITSSWQGISFSGQ